MSSAPASCPGSEYRVRPQRIAEVVIIGADDASYPGMRATVDADFAAVMQRATSRIIGTILREPPEALQAGEEDAIASATAERFVARATATDTPEPRKESYDDWRRRTTALLAECAERHE